MDKNTLRRLAGIDTVSESTATSELNLIRRLAGIPTISVKTQSVLETPDAEEKDDAEAEMDHPEEKDDEHVEAEMDHAEEESKEEESEEHQEKEKEKQEDGLLSFISPLASKAEGLEGDEMVELLMQVYHAGVEDGKNKDSAEK